ncbi:MAG: Hpt domain-containing protein, partial [Sulfuricurvum sp.]|nr:Hpt domain-containing protein [Sulfuricurvum sp.]
MTKQEQVKAIFIEEAGEIIEKLDVDIIRFEENSTDFDLLNEIFRGVHTLKGNANAFGFTRLGEFVHHFEDVLDYYRNTKETVEPQYLSLMVDSVEVIKDVMTCELDALPYLPEDYESCLEHIIELLALKKDGGVAIPHGEAVSAIMDLASEFAISDEEGEEDVVTAAIARMQEVRTEGLSLFRIEMLLDTDCYKRGFDHLLFIKLLAQKAKSIESFFELQGVGTLGEFETDVNVIKKVTVIALSDETSSEV